MLEKLKVAVLLELAEDFYTWECIVWEWTFLLMQHTCQ